MSTRHLASARTLLVAMFGAMLMLIPTGSPPRHPAPRPISERPFEIALYEHRRLFGESSSAILVDPDRYLRSTGFDTESARRDLSERITSLRAANDPGAVAKAIDLVRATTGILGPATIRVDSVTSVDGKPIVLIVSHDSARPFQVAVHSLAGLRDPTVALEPPLTFEEFQSFTRFHESAHAFQHLHGLHGVDASDSPLLHAHEEAEADAFAVLAWFKLREANERVPKLWYAFRLSRYIEMLRERRFDPAIEYYTHTSISAALAKAQSLHRSGELGTMDGNALYLTARRLVDATIPGEPELRLETRQLADALEKFDQYPLRKRLAAIDKGIHSCDAAIAVTLKEYALAMRELLRQSEPPAPEIDQQALALRCWRNQVECDLARTTHRHLVLERLQEHLAGESLNLAFSTATAEEKRAIKTEGDRAQRFVPIELKYAVLDSLRTSR